MIKTDVTFLSYIRNFEEILTRAGMINSKFFFIRGHSVDLLAEITVIVWISICG